MTLLQTLCAFILAIGILVIVHELGHYLVARWCGVKVLRFSVGMGKVVFSRRLGRDRTEWAVSMLPLGGYVKMLDAREQDVGNLAPEELRREFTRQSVWRRIAIVAAGPLANFLLAIVVIAALYMHGMPEPVPKLRAVSEHTAAYSAGLRGGELVTAVNGDPVQSWPQVRWQVTQAVIAKAPIALQLHAQQGDFTVKLQSSGLSAQDLDRDFLADLGLQLARPKAVLGNVIPGGAADQAGLRAGDVVMSANGQPVADSAAFVDLVRSSPGKRLMLQVVRHGAALDIPVTPVPETEKGRIVGRIQVEVPQQPLETISVAEPPLQALKKGASQTWDTSTMTLKMIGKMITGEMSWKNVTGPITIADYAGQTARSGLASFLNFIAFVSISLGIMNLLPIPVLDGGLLLYYSLELLTGRPVSERFVAVAQRAGVGILMVLMAVAVFNDIGRLMS